MLRITMVQPVSPYLAHILESTYGTAIDRTGSPKLPYLSTHLALLVNIFANTCAVRELRYQHEPAKGGNERRPIPVRQRPEVGCT